MRVLYFSDSYGPHDFRFLAFLARSGCEVLYLQRRAGRPSDSRPLPNGVRALSPLHADDGRPRRLGIPLVDELRRILREAAPDVVHAGPIQACAWLVARAGFERLISMSWGSDLLDEARLGLGRWQAAAALRRTSVFLGDCEAVRRRAIALGMDRARTVIFPWGVDLDEFRPGRTNAVRARLGWEDKTVLLCLRAWEPRYGVETIVEAFLRAAGDTPTLRLILGGDGSLQPQLIDRIERSSLADRFWLPGHVPYDELPMLYAAADVYLSASHSDGSSVSLLEAMACGLPAYVTDIPGNLEWVVHGTTGWLFPVGDIRALADLLRDTPGRHPELEGFGRRGRAVVEARADWGRNSPALLRAYDMALTDDREAP
jgi:glycosyltransferase involved in cell wall biosynthesis